MTVVSQDWFSGTILFCEYWVTVIHQVLPKQHYLLYHIMILQGTFPMISHSTAIAYHCQFDYHANYIIVDNRAWLGWTNVQLTILYFLAKTSVHVSFDSCWQNCITIFMNRNKHTYIHNHSCEQKPAANMTKPMLNSKIHIHTSLDHVDGVSAKVTFSGILAMK